DSVAQQPGPIVGMVSNQGFAGNPQRDDILTMAPEYFRQIIDANLTSAVLLVRAMLNRFLQDAPGSVVFLGSNNGQRGCGILGQPSFVFAKDGLPGLLAFLVAHLGRTVRFNLVPPGVVLTQSEN